MKPVCVGCKTLMRRAQIGIYVERRVCGDAYEIWHGDKWKCAQCGVESIAGFGDSPVANYAQVGRYASFLPEVEITV